MLLNIWQNLTLPCFSRAVGKGDTTGGGARPPAPPFSGAKDFFPCKIGKHKTFTCEEHMRLEFTY